MHFVIKCIHCQKVMGQCRCPSPNKTVKYDDCGCSPGCVRKGQHVNSCLAEGVVSVSPEPGSVEKNVAELNRIITVPTAVYSQVNNSVYVILTPSDLSSILKGLERIMQARSIA